MKVIRNIMYFITKGILRIFVRRPKYYFLGDNFKKSFEFLQNTDLKNLECKKHIIDGENIWANVQEMPTKNPETTAWEIHRKYTLHFLFHLTYNKWHYHTHYQNI